MQLNATSRNEANKAAVQQANKHRLHLRLSYSHSKVNDLLMTSVSVPASKTDGFVYFAPLFIWGMSFDFLDELCALWQMLGVIA